MAFAAHGLWTEAVRGRLKPCKEEVTRVDFELLSVPLQSTLLGEWISLFRRQLLHIALFSRNPKIFCSMAVFEAKKGGEYLVLTIDNLSQMW